MAPGDDTRAARAAWLASLRRLVPIPPPHRDPTLDRADALAVLRCPDELLDLLVAEGLPCEDDGDGLRFDRRDVYNLALYSDSGRSLPELGTAFLGRLAREGERGWSEARRWSVNVQIRCPRRDACEPEPAWAFGRPRPDLLGGEQLELRAPPGCDPLAEVLAWPGAHGSASLAGTLVTRGTVDALVAPALREAFASVVDDYAFQVLPPSLRRDLAAVERLRVVDCIAATGLLVRACRAAGYEAHAQSGFLLGLFGYGGHRWVRVRDADGRVKSLDPTLPMIAAMGRHDAGAFRAHCAGSVLNRVVPCVPLDDGEIAGHRCGGQPRTPDLAIRSRRETD